jgi:hypothetical protein
MLYFLQHEEDYRGNPNELLHFLQQAKSLQTLLKYFFDNGIQIQKIDWFMDIFAYLKFY